MSLSFLPIPQQPSGFQLFTPSTLNNNSPSIQLEVFIDLLCSDCVVMWETLMKVVKKHNIQLIVHLFSLPYFTHSFTLMTGLYALLHLSTQPAASIVKEYIELIFSHQQFSTKSTSELTPALVKQQLAQLNQLSSLTTSAQDFFSAMQHIDVVKRSKVAWKYACSRGVSGTPAIFVNGVQVMCEAEWSEDKWNQMLANIKTQ